MHIQIPDMYSNLQIIITIITIITITIIIFTITFFYIRIEWPNNNKISVGIGYILSFLLYISFQFFQRAIFGI